MNGSEKIVLAICAVIVVASFISIIRSDREARRNMEIVRRYLDDLEKKKEKNKNI